jgi:choline dehydrogenase-like flavoprotein
MGPVLISPKSRGEIRLRSSDPIMKPSIITNTLAEPEDLAALVTGVELAREIAAAEPLVAVRGREIYPGPDARDDADVEAHVRRAVELLYHPSGTCRMGAEDAVLDPELRVRGVEGLRVVDASVFPVIPGGNTNAPTIMVAERAADLVRGLVADASGAATA